MLTIEQAIYRLDRLKISMNDRYRNAIDMAISALEKQQPAKPIMETTTQHFLTYSCTPYEVRYEKTFYYCPVCNERVDFNNNCKNCNKQLDWSDVEE